MADLNTNIEETQQEQETQQENNAPTVEELLAQIAQKDAAYAKLKNASDKTSSDVAKLKKQIAAMQTAEQQAAAAKEEAEEAKREAEEQHKEYVEGLEKFQKRAMAKDRYLLQGMDADTAAKAAEAEVGGDMDALSAINKAFTDRLVKNREIELRKSIPDPKLGVGDGGEDDPFLKGFNSVGNFYTQKK